MRKINAARVSRAELIQHNVIRVAAQVQNAIIAIESTKIAPIEYIVMMAEQDLEAMFKESQMESMFYMKITEHITNMAEVIRDNADAETFTNNLSESINRLFGFIQEDTKKRRFMNVATTGVPSPTGESPAIHRSTGNSQALAEQFPNIVKFRPDKNGSGDEDN